MKRWIHVDVVETSPGRFVVGVGGRWFRILEREGMVIVSKFRCDMIQVPSGRSEHWLLIKIILMKKIERKTGAGSNRYRFEGSILRHSIQIQSIVTVNVTRRVYILYKSLSLI